jgi:hypothetical protein
MRDVLGTAGHVACLRGKQALCVVTIGSTGIQHMCNSHARVHFTRLRRRCQTAHTWHENRSTQLHNYGTKTDAGLYEYDPHGCIEVWKSNMRQ